MEVRVLGPLEVMLNEHPASLGGTRPRSIMGLLSLAPGRVVSSDTLIDQCWPGHDVRKARASLQVAVVRLRDAVGSDRIQTIAPGYLLDVPPDAVDAHVFVQLARQGRADLHAARYANAAEALSTGLGLWRGRVLADVITELSDPSGADRLERERDAAHVDLMEARLGQGRHLEVLDELQEITRDHPLDERLAGLLMLGLYRAGRQVDALSVASDLRRRLADDLGVDPSSRLRDLEHLILNHDASLAAPTGRRTVMETLRTQERATSHRPAWLVHDGQRVSLDRAVTTIGRLEDRTIVVRDPDVSRRHAEVRRVGDRFLLVDAGSTNGTRVAGEPVYEHELRDGDTVEVGSTALVFEVDVD